MNGDQAYYFFAYGKDIEPNLIPKKELSYALRKTLEVWQAFYDDETTLSHLGITQAGLESRLYRLQDEGYISEAEWFERQELRKKRKRKAKLSVAM